MPPFCIPCPYVLSETHPVSPPPRQREEENRARMIASFVTALSDAEGAASEQNNVDIPGRRHRLATEAYNSLCFDFPIVPTSGLAALDSAFRSSTLDVGLPVFPVTERFTSGLRYLVSIEFTKQGILDGIVSTTSAVDGEIESQATDDLKTRYLHLVSLCGCIFLLAPSLRLAVAHKDDGASLHDFLAAFNPSPIDPLEENCFPEDLSMSDTGLGKDQCRKPDEFFMESTVYDEGEVEVADEDSDWEELETFVPPSGLATSSQEFIFSGGGRTELSDLMNKVVLLTGLVPSEVIDTSIWRDLKLTEHLIQAMNSMRMLERKEAEEDVITTAKLYAELLSDHLLSDSGTSSSEVAHVVSSLLVLVETDGEAKLRNFSKSAVDNISRKSWELLVLGTLAKLCSKIGRCPARTMSLTILPNKRTGSKESKRSGSLPSPSFVRGLWQAIFSNLQFLQVQLTEPLGGHDSFSRLEMVLWILCFLVKCAPGNVDMRASLLEGGIFRVAVQLFVKVGAEPQMESLRHFLLLSMASSPALAHFAAQVPSFRTAISAPELFVEGSFTRAYALIWPLLIRAAYCQSSTSKTKEGYSDQFRSSEAESVLVSAFSSIVEAVADNVIQKNPSSFLKNLALLHWLLVLLEETATASSGSVFKLWRLGSPLDINIGRCQIALGALLARETDVAPSTSPPGPVTSQKKKTEGLDEITHTSDLLVENSSRSPDGELKQSVVESSTGREKELVAVQEKLKQLLPSLLLQLKRLSILTKGSPGAKID